MKYTSESWLLQLGRGHRIGLTEMSDPKTYIQASFGAEKHVSKEIRIEMYVLLVKSHVLTSYANKNLCYYVHSLKKKLKTKMNVELGPVRCISVRLLLLGLERVQPVLK